MMVNALKTTLLALIVGFEGNNFLRESGIDSTTPFNVKAVLGIAGVLLILNLINLVDDHRRSRHQDKKCKE